MKVQNKIHLKTTYVKSIDFNFRKNVQKGELSTSINIETNSLFDEEVDDEYAVSFVGSFENEIFDLKTEFIAVFGTSEKIEDDFKESDFVKINSPAIAFPFLRSFIATFTLNAGVPPFVLPAYNFVQPEKETV